MERMEKDYICNIRLQIKYKMIKIEQTQQKKLRNKGMERFYFVCMYLSYNRKVANHKPFAQKYDLQSNNIFFRKRILQVKSLSGIFDEFSLVNISLPACIHSPKCHYDENAFAICKNILRTRRKTKQFVQGLELSSNN